MTDIAQIKGFNLGFSLTQLGSKAPMSITQPLLFDSITSVVVKEGTYTPNNDYEYLWQNIPANEAPNFIFIQTPTLVYLSVRKSDNTLIANAVPVNKCHMLLLPPGTLVDNVYLEGRVSQATPPMPQGVPASFFCLMAQANF